MKILMGGIPLGCDNIGDEAIIANAIAIVRRARPDAEITVSTKQEAEYRRRFGVRTIPLYGFDPAYPVREFAQAVARFDVYMWAGATGLSDYPDMGCALLEMAQKHRVATIIWQVGMSDTLNPYYFRLSGKRLRLCRLLRPLLPNLRNAWEARRIAAARKRIYRLAGQCRLVVTRNAESLQALNRCGSLPGAISGADSAILQTAVSAECLAWPDEADRRRYRQAPRKIAVCLASQSPVRDLDSFAAWMDAAAVRDPSLLFVLVPMNLKTDHPVLSVLRDKMAHPESALLTGFPEPEEVQAVAGGCDLVISSRLHLLIFGTNELVPGIGISRGDKIDAFLRRFGLSCCGSTDQVDYAAMTEQMTRLLNDPGFAERARPVRQAMLAELAETERKLAEALGS